MLDAVIIEPVLEKRTHFREIARDFCKSVSVSSTLQDGAERIRSLKNCDVIYVSSRFDFEAAKQFVANCRKFEVAKDSANLLIAGRELCSESYLAKLSLNGFDGVLVEPASVETFKVSAEIALKARSEKLNLRTRKSIDILVKSLAQQLDELCLKKKTGHIFFMAQEKLKNLGIELKSLNAEGLNLYFETLLECFPERQPVMLPKEDAGSASQRVLLRRLKKS